MAWTTDLRQEDVSKPIYNHITGELDPYEEVPPHRSSFLRASTQWLMIV